MKPIKGYYSLIQYCPDLSRLEAANIGVPLFCPEPHFIRARTCNSLQRIRRFFGSAERDWDRIRESKDAIEERLEVEGEQFRSLKDLEHFIATRANEIQLTPPRPVKIFNPEQDLELLFKQLVGGPTRRKAIESVNQRLQESFTQQTVAPFIRRDVTVAVPTFHRSLTVPFGFQDGRFHLIQPASFSSKALYQACRYAVEGRSLHQHPDEKLGELQLIVVGDFEPNQGEAQVVVKDILTENQVSFFPLPELPRLIEVIQATGRPTQANGRGEAQGDRGVKNA